MKNKKTKPQLEYRMYGLVNYQLSGIQKGIQFGHAVVEYSESKYSKDSDYRKWAKTDKTFIILNGGTTNNSPYLDLIGTMNKHLMTLESNKIKVAKFYEPDFGRQLTAVVFLVDERVFNEEKYPDNNGVNPIHDWEIGIDIFNEEKYPDNNGVNPIEDWTIGIDKKELKKIMFLRKFLKPFKLA